LNLYNFQKRCPHGPLSVYEKLGNPAVIPRCPKNTLTDPISLSEISNSASCISSFAHFLEKGFYIYTCKLC